MKKKKVEIVQILINSNANKNGISRIISIRTISSSGEKSNENPIHKL